MRADQLRRIRGPIGPLSKFARHSANGIQLMSAVAAWLEWLGVISQWARLSRFQHRADLLKKLEDCRNNILPTI